MDIKDKIYNLRKKSGLSQEDLGFKLGVSRQNVSKWEAGFVQPSFENLKSLCDVFQVSLSYFEEVADCANEAAADVDDDISSVDNENADNIATASDENQKLPKERYKNESDLYNKCRDTFRVVGNYARVQRCRWIRCVFFKQR